MKREIRVENRSAEPVVYIASFDGHGLMLRSSVAFVNDGLFPRAPHVHVDGICDLFPSCRSRG